MYIRSFTKVIDEAIYTVRNKIGELLVCKLLGGLIMAGAGIAAFILLIISIAVSAVSIMPRYSGYSYDEISAQPGFIIGIVISIAIIAILLGAVSYVSSGAVMLVTYHAGRGEKMNGTSAIGKSFSRFFAYLGYVTLQLLTLIPVIIIIVLLIAMLGGGLTEAFNNTFSMMDFEDRPIQMLLIILGIWLVVVIVSTVIALMYQTLFLYGLPAIVIEKLGPIAAYKKNLSYIRGEFWATLRKIFLYQMGVIGINISLNAVVSIIFALIIILQTSFGNVDETALATSFVYIEYLIRIGYSIITGCFIPSIIVKLYESQRCKLEGQDIRERLVALKQVQLKEMQISEGSSE